MNEPLSSPMWGEVTDNGYAKTAATVPVAQARSNQRPGVGRAHPRPFAGPQLSRKASLLPEHSTVGWTEAGAQLRALTRWRQVRPVHARLGKRRAGRKSPAAAVDLKDDGP
jgi:hypothetical protein